MDTTFSPPANTLDGNPAYTENYAPVILDANVQILDAELSATNNYNGATLTLSRHGGASTQDVFSASGGTLTILSEGSYFSVNSITIGRVTTNSTGTLTLTFNANATESLVNMAMQHIAYSNNSDAPPATVQIDWTFNDGNTGSQGTGGAGSVTGSTTVSITAVNDAPYLSTPISELTAAVNATFNYVIPNTTFIDPDGDSLTYTLAMVDGTGLPPWLSLNSATRTMSGTPSTGDTGSLYLRITATDGSGASASNDVGVNVTPLNIINKVAAGNILSNPAALGDVSHTGTGSDLVTILSPSNLVASDTIDGLTGADEISFTSITAGQTLTLGAGVINFEKLSIGTGTETTALNVNAAAVLIGMTITGNDGNNVITGTQGADNITAGLGNDFIYSGLGNTIIDGGAGIDTVAYNTVTSGIAASLAVSGPQVTYGSGTDTFYNVENLGGGAYNDTLTGNSGNNTIWGNGGNDTIFSGLGNTIIDGGAGIDTVAYNTVTSGIAASLAATGPQVTYGSGTDTFYNVENLGGGAYNDTLTGNSGNNTIWGNGGNDTIFSGLGNTIIDGGAGIDTVAYNTVTSGIAASLAISGPQVTYGSGTDTFYNVENLGGGAYNDTLTGNSGSNTLWGNGGDDMLISGTGNTIIDGGAGIDTVAYNTATSGVAASLAISGPQVTYGSGTDTFYNIENLKGGNYNDTLAGNGNNNTLTGGLGKDVLTGGAGNDTFAYSTITESVVGVNRDIITDFLSGTDKINLTAIDAISTTAGVNDAFSYIGSGAFTNTAGQLRYDVGIVYGDIDGNGISDFEIALTGVASVTGADFVL